MQTIIDTHLHLWDLQRFTLPWLDSLPPLRRNHTLADYTAASGGAEWRIEGALYVEVDVAAGQKAAEAEYAAALCRDPGAFVSGAIISADLMRPDVAADLAPYRNEGAVKGVRHALHVPSSPRGTCLNPTFIANMRRLGTLGLVFEACLRCAELPDLAVLARQCPQTRIMLNHMGNIDPAVAAGRKGSPADRAAAENWRRSISDLAACPNVVCKISGLMPARPWDVALLEPAVSYCLDAFGEDRVAFGGNWPVCNLSTGLAPWISALLAITGSRTASFRTKLFRDNARRFYGL